MRLRNYAPKSEVLKDIRRRISERSWWERVADARRREKIVEKILKRVAQGESQNAAIAATGPKAKRSARLRDVANYGREGLEGLIDRRTPRVPASPIWVRDAIEVARMANPAIGVEEVEKILQQKYRSSPSSASIKRIWKDAGLERRVGRRRAVGSTPVEEPQVEPLEAAGFQLVRASEAETGAVGRLVETVLEVAKALPEPRPVSLGDRKLRNKKGQLTAKYNRVQGKAPGAGIAPPHRTVEEKAADRDLGRLAFGGQPRETVERKVWALVSLPAVTPLKGRVEDLRGPQGRLLKEMCGYAYQAETIRKVVSEFTVAGVGPLLQQTHAATWHEISVERWETDYRAAVVYVDNTVKPLWTGLFTKATKVSSTGRVQPALTSTFVNTGVGVPIHFETYSGAAPLAPRVLQVLEHVEDETEHRVGRLTVIDGECCSASLLLAFKEAGRDLVVPLPTPMIKAKRFRFGRGSAFRPYRDGDQIREGAITLHDSKDRTVTLDARAILIERRTKETWTVLVTLADPEVWGPRGIAEAYFGRWPNQEGFFRRANQALGLKHVHGYGKRVVTNTAVITELEQLQTRIERAQTKQAEETEQLQAVEQELAALHKERHQVARYRAKREERVDVGLDTGRTHSPQFATASAELREATEAERRLEAEAKTRAEKQQRLTSRMAKRQDQIEKWAREREKLYTRTEIVEADVAQDTLFTVMKLTLGMLVHFVVAEYFSDRPLEWATFLSRIAMLPGRRETTTDTVTVVIYGNRRDVKLMQALARACQSINKRHLVHEDKRLRYVVEWPDGIPKGWLV
ncbi:MAG: hypothetical protein V3R72_07170 [Gammaproteobacteria bacterium]